MFSPRRIALVSLALLLLSGCGRLPTGDPVLPSPTPTLAGPAPAVPDHTPPEPTAAAALASPTPSGSPGSCTEIHGSVQPYQIPWEEEVITGRVYTPPCYDQSPQASYSTLYLLHGATDTDQQWIDLGVDQMADELIEAGKIPPLVIVMPREKTWVSLPDNPFGDQLIQAVIPWVESHYRVVPSRHYRAVGGLSRGGNWAIRLALLDWGLFGSLGCHSAPLFYGDLNKAPDWLEAIPLDKMPRIYIDIGEGDHNLEQAQAFRELLEENGVTPEWHLNAGLHNDDYWRSHVGEYLAWYSLGWPDPER